MLAHTRATDVFAVSSGALLVLEAARILGAGAIARAALFEPPYYLDPASCRPALQRLDDLMARGRVGTAMVAAMKASEMGPPFLRKVPTMLLAPMVTMAMRGEARKPAGEYILMADLARTLHYDFTAVVEAAGSPERFETIDTQVLLMSASRSPRYLAAALDTLEKRLPHVSRVQFAGLDHAASWNSDRGGNPRPVADALSSFFS
jgi:hypothetical protein